MPSEQSVNKWLWAQCVLLYIDHQHETPGNNAQKKNGHLIFIHPRLGAALNRQNQNVCCGVAGFMRPLPLFIVYPKTNGFL